MKTTIYSTCICMLLLFSSCKKESDEQPAEELTKEQQQMQGKWTSVYFKRYDYDNGQVSRVVEGDIASGEYVEYFGRYYRFFDGKELIDRGETFSFENGELAVRGANSIYYTKIQWQSPDAYVETRDNGSSAGGPANRSVFEYFYVRKTD